MIVHDAILSRAISGERKGRSARRTMSLPSIRYMRRRRCPGIPAAVKSGSPRNLRRFLRTAVRQAGLAAEVGPLA